MTRLLKALGIAMSAVAVLAVMASAAQAETGTLTATEYPAFITGEQAGPVVFDIGAGPGCQGREPLRGVNQQSSSGARPRISFSADTTAAGVNPRRIRY